MLLLVCAIASHLWSPGTPSRTNRVGPWKLAESDTSMVGSSGRTSWRRVGRRSEALGFSKKDGLLLVSYDNDGQATVEAIDPKGNSRWRQDQCVSRFAIYWFAGFVGDRFEAEHWDLGPSNHGPKQPKLGSDRTKALDKLRNELRAKVRDIRTGRLIWDSAETEFGEPFAASGDDLWVSRISNLRNAYAGKARERFVVERLDIRTKRKLGSWKWPSTLATPELTRWKVRRTVSTESFSLAEPQDDAATIRPMRIVLNRKQGSLTVFTRNGRLRLG
jgi:hypothetical protein